MLQTVEAIVDPSGAVRLLEAVTLSSPRRALVTLLETPADDPGTAPGSSAALLDFLAKSRLPAAARLTADEIDAQIEAERNAWD